MYELNCLQKKKKNLNFDLKLCFPSSICACSSVLLTCLYFFYAGLEIGCQQLHSNVGNGVRQFVKGISFV